MKEHTQKPTSQSAIPPAFARGPGREPGGEGEAGRGGSWSPACGGTEGASARSSRGAEWGWLRRVSPDMQVPRASARGAPPERGFTLIEVLVVAAIIGVLASVVMVSLWRVRVKARSSRIIGDVEQMRLVAEDVFDSNGGEGFCVPAPGLCASSDPRMLTLKGDADEQNGAYPAPTVVAGAAFCVAAQLADGGTYCADSRGKFSGSWFGPSGGSGTCVAEACQ